MTETPASRAEVVLISPSRAGKSTLAALLAERLEVPHVSQDAIKWRYFEEMGFGEAAGRRIRQRDGFRALTLRLRPYALAMVERVLAERRDCVFDFGAGHSMFDDPEHVERIRRALAPFRHVALVLLSPDLDRSVRVLRKRSGAWIPDGRPTWLFPVTRSSIRSIARWHS